MFRRVTPDQEYHLIYFFNTPSPFPGSGRLQGSILKKTQNFEHNTARQEEGGMRPIHTEGYRDLCLADDLGLHSLPTHRKNGSCCSRLVEYSHEWELSRKCGLSRGEPPVPMEQVAQANNVHTHGDPPCTTHRGAAPLCATSGSPWVWAFLACATCSMVRAVLP